MRCSNCNAPLPEGSKICNVCGAALSPNVKAMSAAELRKETTTELGALRLRIKGIAYEVGRLYKCRLISLILSLIGIVVTIWYCVSGAPERGTSEALWYLIFDVGLVIASIIVLICLLVVLNDMKDYHPRFWIVFILILVYIGLDLVLLFVDNALLSMVLSLLEIGAIIGYTCNLYGSMEDITRNAFGRYVGRWLNSGTLSMEWKHLLKLYVGVSVAVVLLTLLSGILSMDGDDSVVIMAIILSVIGEVAVLVISFFEVRLFRWTWYTLERLEYTKRKP